MMDRQSRLPQVGLYEQLVAQVVLAWLIGRCLIAGQWPFQSASTGLSWDL